MKRFLVAVLQVVGYFAAVVVVVAAAAVPVRAIFGDSDSVATVPGLVIVGLLFISAVAVVNSLMVWKGRSRLVRVGWLGPRPGLRAFGFGSLVGLGTAAAMLALTLVTARGRLTFESGHASQYLFHVVPLLCGLLLMAGAEEFLFRGYPITRLAAAVGPWWANILIAILFVAAHWGGDGWTYLPAVNIFLLSLLAGAVRFTPGGIPAAWGFHFVWNSLQVLVGATLTGEDFQVPMVGFVTAGDAWLSGGAFGPEGALGATISMTVAIVLLGRYLPGRGGCRSAETQNR
jgi:membrane protease YdiL (CAAX protease family)